MEAPSLNCCNLTTFNYDTTAGSTTAAVTTETSSRSHCYQRQTRWQHEPRSPGDKEEAGEAGEGGALVKCGGSRLDEGGGGAGRSSDGCYWSFFSESDESSLVPSSSGEVSSYLNISVSSPLSSATMTGKPTQAGTR